MEQIKVYRHELKYFLTNNEYLIYSGIFKKILKMDENCRDQDGYWIRSLYFDTLENKDFYEKLIGVNQRKKIRLRLYDLDQERVKVEIKNRFGEFMMKETANISRAQAKNMINNENQFLLGQNNPTLARVFYFMSRDYYRPAVLIDYYREAFLCDYQNIRITFDKNIRASTVDFDLFSSNVKMIPIFDFDAVVMEVKFQSVLPEYVKQIISRCNGIRQAISKYCLSRILY